MPKLIGFERYKNLPVTDEMFEKSPSNLPPLKSGSRSQLSSAPSYLSRSRKSTSSLLSLGSDLQSTGSQSKNRKPFKPISYFIEKRIVPSQDVYHHYQRLMRLHRAALSALIEEKGQIVVSMQREREHIDALNKENEKRQTSIRETLQVLRNSSGKNRVEGQPPSISQLRQIANTILREGLKFKQLSERPQRIDKEVEGVDSLNENAPFDLRQTLGEDANLDKIMEFQRTKLSNLVFKRENARLRLETIMSNRDMLTRVIFDHKTALETLKLKKQNLQEEAERLADEFDKLLEEASERLGEVVWRNAMVRACNDISCMSKS